MPSGSGTNDALDAKVYDTLVREFGEERARAILGGQPARRRAQVPDVVGKRAKPAPAIGRPKVRGVSWRERPDRAGRPKVSVRVYKRQGINCHDCGTRVPPGDEHLLVTTLATQYRYCPPCGLKASRGGGSGT